MTSHQVDLNWSKPKRQTTARGERLVSEASLDPHQAKTQAFWTLWRAQKQALLEAGYSVQKFGDAWVVKHYQPIPKEEQEKIIAAKAAAREASRATDANISIPVPEGLSYLPYQKAGIAFAGERPATLIADEMGLGKTIQAIGLINADTAIKTVLVICPASLRLNWQRELQKWLIRPLRIAVIQSGKDLWPANEADCIIINYDILKKYRQQLRASTWDLLVADECHYLKSGKAQRTQEVVGKRPAKDKDDSKSFSAIPAKRRLFLTGTPIVNRPNELWPIVSFLHPSEWKNFFSFAKRYCGAFHNGYGWDFSGATHLDELQNRLRETIMIRRLKADVLTELPAKRRQVLALPANGASQCIKNEQEAEARHESALLAAKIAVELAKASSDPADYERAVAKLRDVSNAAFSEIARLRHETALAKVPYVVEHVLDSSGPVVIMAHHHDVVDGIKAGLEKEHPGSVVTLTGQDKLQDRQDAVDRFQAGKAQYFIGSIRAAGVGITLTAASHVVFAELDWTPGAMSQAEDRCHRIGQVNSVLVQHIVLDGSIDARLANTLVSKQTVIDQALDKPTIAQPAEIETQPDLELDTLLEAAAEWKLAKATQQDRGTARKPVDVRRQALVEAAAKITEAQQIAVHEGLRQLNAVNSDGARILNGIGFNRVDSGIGRDLAEQASLSKLQAALGAKILRKYRRQLGSGLYGSIFDQPEE